MDIILIVLAVIINIPIMFFIFKKTYKTKEEMIRSLEYDAKPDLISVLDGTILEDMKHENKSRKFTFYMMLVIIVEYLIYKGVLILIDKI